MSPDWFYLKSPGRHMTRCGFSQCGCSSASSVAAQTNYVKYIPGLLGNKGGMVSSNQIRVSGLTCDSCFNILYQVSQVEKTQQYNTDSEE